MQATSGCAASALVRRCPQTWQRGGLPNTRRLLGVSQLPRRAAARRRLPPPTGKKGRRDGPDSDWAVDVNWQQQRQGSSLDWGDSHAHPSQRPRKRPAEASPPSPVWKKSWEQFWDQLKYQYYQYCAWEGIEEGGARGAGGESRDRMASVHSGIAAPTYR